MKLQSFSLLAGIALLSWSCGGSKTSEESSNSLTTDQLDSVIVDDFAYETEQFADIKILRYQVPGFEDLKKPQKELLYYLYEAALAGRDIIWDQNYKHNLCVRRTIEAIVGSYEGDKNTEDYKNFMVYAKRIWFSNGIHHHYSNDKLIPDFTTGYFEQLVRQSDVDKLPLSKGETVDALIKKLTPVIFDPSVAPKKVSQDASSDMVANSAVNFYDGVSQAEADQYYEGIIDKNNPKPVSYGLNSRLVKSNGKITEKVWKVGGVYSEAIEKIVFWLEKASGVAENPNQKAALDKLIEYYKTGDLQKFNEYNIDWVNDTSSVIDVVNGFIEVYNDPLGRKGSFESVVSMKDMTASKRIAAIGKEAQWFEDNSSISTEHKKKNVIGISAKVITVVVESGDASPSTPIGINLPNEDWIRAEHGSKSVQLGNIVYAYDMVSKGSGFLEEFCYNDEEIKRAKAYGNLADMLHTDMHEVIGHASGQINPGVGTPETTLKSYASCLEEARADLVALYFMLDEKLIQIGVMPSLEVGKAGYDDYILNGMMGQLKRLKPGDNIEEAHMRNRQLVASWVYEKGKDSGVIDKIVKNGKTYFVIKDYDKLRKLFGELLKEIQRIKSEGDYEAGKALVENYGVKVDQQLLKEVLERFSKLNTAPYQGFINPRLVAVKNEFDKITDVKIEYPFGFTDQMMFYSREHSFLPTYN